MCQRKFRDKCRTIQLVITDIDGVLTDGGMYYGPDDGEWKKFNVRDGVGVALLKADRIKIGAITGENNQLGSRRMRKIGGDFLFYGIKDKLTCLVNYCTENDYAIDEVLYIGDEINDYELCEKVGLFFAPSDACDDIKEKANIVLNTAGGKGVLREAARVLLNARGSYESAMEKLLKDYRENVKSETDETCFIEF